MIVLSNESYLVHLIIASQCIFEQRDTSIGELAAILKRPPYQFGADNSNTSNPPFAPYAPTTQEQILQ